MSRGSKRIAFFFGWQQGRCYIGGCRMRLLALREREVAPMDSASEDHGRPKSRGFGKAYNSALACWACNNTRGSRPPTACMLLFCHEVWTAFEETAGCQSVPTVPFVATRTGCAPATRLRERRSMETAIHLAFDVASCRFQKERRARAKRMQRSIDRMFEASP